MKLYSNRQRNGHNKYNPLAATIRSGGVRIVNAQCEHNSKLINKNTRHSIKGTYLGVKVFQLCWSQYLICDVLPILDNISFYHHGFYGQFVWMKHWNNMQMKCVCVSVYVSRTCVHPIFIWIELIRMTRKPFSTSGLAFSSMWKHSNTLAVMMFISTKRF